MDCIKYEMNSRGSLPALYSLGVTLQVGLDLNLLGYMISIYKEYDIYYIFIYRQDVFWLPYGARWLEPSTVGLDLMGWTSPGSTVHVHCRGYLGLYSPQLILERFVSAEQRRLEQIRAV